MSGGCAVGFGGGGFAVAQPPDGFDWVAEPEMAPLGAGPNNHAAPTTWEGGSYYSFRSLDFARLIVFVSAVAVPGSTLVVGLYQSPGGLTTVPQTLVQSYSRVIAAPDAGNPVSLTGAARIVPGVFSLIWGTTGGAGDFTITCYSTNSFALLSNNMAASTRPLAFQSAVGVTDPAPGSWDAITQGTPAGATNVVLTARFARP